MCLLVRLFPLVPSRSGESARARVGRVCYRPLRCVSVWKDSSGWCLVCLGALPLVPPTVNSWDGWLLPCTCRSQVARCALCLPCTPWTARCRVASHLRDSRGMCMCVCAFLPSSPVTPIGRRPQVDFSKPDPPKPSWLKIQAPTGQTRVNFDRLGATVKSLNLATVGCCTCVLVSLTVIVTLSLSSSWPVSFLRLLGIVCSCCGCCRIPAITAAACALLMTRCPSLPPPTPAPCVLARCARRPSAPTLGSVGVAQRALPRAPSCCWGTRAPGAADSVP